MPNDNVNRPLPWDRSKIGRRMSDGNLTDSRHSTDLTPTATEAEVQPLIRGALPRPLRSVDC